MIDACSRVAAMTLALATTADWARAEDPDGQRQRQQQIEQQARQMEQFFRPAVHAELELLRATCGSLTIEARRIISAAGNEAVKEVARQFAERQMAGKGLQDFDARKTIRDKMAAIVEQHAASEEFAAYEREQASRIARRSRAARMLLMNKIEREFVLSRSQREKIEHDLEEHWDATWSRELDDRGIMINNRSPAPDFADRCIAPHLDDRQREEWTNWCEQAGWNRRGLAAHAGWNFDGQSMQPDPWWTP